MQVFWLGPEGGKWLENLFWYFEIDETIHEYLMGLINANVVHNSGNIRVMEIYMYVRKRFMRYGRTCKGRTSLKKCEDRSMYVTIILKLLNEVQYNILTSLV